jgi:hypothetical protein
MGYRIEFTAAAKRQFDKLPDVPPGDGWSKSLTGSAATQGP